jgi:hypothetical protein
MQTESESLFESFCASLELRYERIPRDKTRTADYRIYPGDHEVVAEVKQLESNAEDQAHAVEIEQGKVAARSYPVGKRVRQEIVDSKAQIRAIAKDRCPGLVVLFNNIPFGHSHTDPMMVLTAMYGQIKAIVAVPRDFESSPYVADTVFGGSRSVTEAHNTSISAVCVLYTYEGGPALNFYHNSFATKKFDPSWLRATSVRHYGVANAGTHRFEDWQEV